MTKVCETEPSYSAKLLYKKLEHIRKCMKKETVAKKKKYYRIQKLFKLKKTPNKQYQVKWSEKRRYSRR